MRRIRFICSCVVVSWVALSASASVADEAVCEEACFTEGRCSLDEASGECIVTSDEDCEQSMDCDIQGACAFEEGACVATDAGCLASSGCTEHGECSARDGQCVTTAEGCRASAVCDERGRCGFDEASARCVAIDEADCAASLDCRDDGQCALDGQRCVATDASCEASALCTEQGRCTADTRGEFCEATSTIHCRKSTGCAAEGNCALDAAGDRCVPTTSDDCTASTACAEQGYCHFYEGTAPKKEKKPDAAPSDRRDAVMAKSSMVGMLHTPSIPAHCGPADATACEASNACRDEGACEFVEADPYGGPLGMGSARTVCLPPRASDFGILGGVHMEGTFEGGFGSGELDGDYGFGGGLGGAGGEGVGIGGLGAGGGGGTLDLGDQYEPEDEDEDTE